MFLYVQEGAGSGDFHIDFADSAKRDEMLHLLRLEVGKRMGKAQPGWECEEDEADQPPATWGGGKKQLDSAHQAFCIFFVPAEPV